MERIVLEVDDATGKVYQNFSQENRRKFNQVVSVVLKKVINDAGAGDYKQMLDDMGAEATSNGLTPEILNELLSTND